MAAKTSLEGLIKWLDRAEWREPFEETLWLHVGPACKRAGIGFESIQDVLGDHHARTLLGCAFEDFLTRSLAPERPDQEARYPDGINVVDDYLKRRGWKETAPNRRYMRALRGSVMSLYEVGGFVPGESFLARDLLRGGEPVRISEHGATKTLAPWQRIGARVIELDGKLIIGGGLLPFTPGASETVTEVFKTGRTRAWRELRRLAEVEGAADVRPDPGGLDRLVLESSAPVFSNIWLADALPGAMGLSKPRLVNSDGDTIAFYTLRFAFRPGATAEVVRERLRAVKVFEEASGTFWNWVEAQAAAAGPNGARRVANPAAGDVQTYSVTLDDGAVVLGDIELADDAVLLMANSRSRAERGQVLLATLLGGLVGEPLTQVQNAGEMMASPPGHGTAATDAIPPDIEASLMHEVMDNHYRATLGKPLKMLDGKTPRACARTKAGREKVADWLEHLENQTSGARLEADDPMASYDFAWIWTELGITDLRQ